jgi:hypothetical protein
MLCSVLMHFWSVAMKFALTILVLLTLPSMAFPHHSRAAYDADTVTVIEGDLVDVRWRNPHIVFTLRVTDANGIESTWRMEAGSIYMLRRGGLTEESFRTGQRVRVAGHLSKTTDRDFLSNSILFPDGREVMAMPGAEAHWSDESLGGRDFWEADIDRLEESVADGRGIFQVWSVPQHTSDTSTLPFTQAAIAARAKWDMIDNPLTRCEQPGLPRIMLNPHPFQFIDNGETITVLGEEFDMVRTIHLNSALDPETQPPSNLGYSIGRWNAGTLEVRTTRINWPYFDSIGTPQSEVVEIHETFSISEDQRQLTYHITVVDPVTMTDPAEIERVWLALDETVEPFDCEVF